VEMPSKCSVEKALQGECSELGLCWKCWYEFSTLLIYFKFFFFSLPVHMAWQKKFTLKTSWQQNVVSSYKLPMVMYSSTQQLATNEVGW